MDDNQDNERGQMADKMKNELARMGGKDAAALKYARTLKCMHSVCLVREQGKMTPAQSAKMDLLWHNAYQPALVQQETVRWALEEAVEDAKSEHRAVMRALDGERAALEENAHRLRDEFILATRGEDSADSAQVAWVAHAQAPEEAQQADLLRLQERKAEADAESAGFYPSKGAHAPAQPGSQRGGGSGRGGRGGSTMGEARRAAVNSSPNRCAAKDVEDRRLAEQRRVEEKAGGSAL